MAAAAMAKPESCQRSAPGSVNIPVAPWPPTAQDTSANTDAVADDVVGKLNHGLTHGDFQAVGDLFLPDGYWRDHLALTWQLRTIKGRDNIVDFLGQNRNLSSIEVDRSSSFCAPHMASLDHLGNVKGVEFVTKLTTKFGVGRGVIRLAQQDGQWKIWTLYTTLLEIKGYEEPVNHRRTQGVQHGESAGRKSWLDQRSEDAGFELSDPVVLIVGAGQAGLTAHARLKMLHIPALIIDTNEAIGDNWRRRYHHLVLHDPIWYDHMPYLNFPPQWPVFTPKDKLADFFESYAKMLELNVWTKTRLEACTWDDQAKLWTVKVLRTLPDGTTKSRTMHPKHIIQATGHSGEKHHPTFPGMETFKGDVFCHSSEFKGAKKNGKGLRAIVIGSCNSSHDICQDYYENGYDVTMVQRSTTFVLSSDSVVNMSLAGLYDEDGPPVEDADLWMWSRPSEVLKAHHVQLTQRVTAADKEILDGLARAGFQTDTGPDDAGHYFKYCQRGGGYYIDVGASKLIIDGKLKVKQGQEIAEVLPQGLRFADGSVLEADEVVFATGYQSMRTQARAIFGDDVADRMDDVWGFDGEGEIRAMWRKTGHPGFWVHGGNLAFCRWYSRILALQIKALVEGLTYDEA